jgi:hypothetical protein
MLGLKRCGKRQADRPTRRTLPNHIPPHTMIARTVLLATVVATVAAQQAFSGGGVYKLVLGPLCKCLRSSAVSFTLPDTVGGACGRVCNGTITCKQTGYSKQCSGADAAVPRDVFFA